MTVLRSIIIILNANKIPINTLVDEAGRCLGTKRFRGLCYINITYLLHNFPPKIGAKHQMFWPNKKFFDRPTRAPFVKNTNAFKMSATNIFINLFAQSSTLNKPTRRQECRVLKKCVRSVTRVVNKGKYKLILKQLFFPLA